MFSVNLPPWRLFSFILVVGFLVGLAASDASAQRWRGWGGYGGWGGNPYKAATAGESYARGYSDVIRSAGQFNLDTAKAAGELEDAKAKNIQNRLSSVQTYYDIRRINQEWRDSQRRPVRSASDWARINSQWRPDRLSTSQLDPVTGSLSWPLLLQTDDYAQSRDTIEQIFAKKASAEGHITPDDYNALVSEVEQLRATLKSNIERYRPTDYMRARNFIDSLNEEATMIAQR